MDGACRKRTNTILLAGSIGLFAAAPIQSAEELPRVRFQRERHQVVVLVGTHAMATYVFEDATIPRPYFANVRAPGGVQVTRNHPPVAGLDDTDHATFHPGIWLAFGDISGHDYWRLQARVKHAGFVGDFQERQGAGSFTVRNQYLSGQSDGVVCGETCRYDILVRPAGYLLICDSRFESDKEFSFGDQEEMGLGVRVATKMSVRQGGRITNSDGLVNEKQLWGKPADWCDYGGLVDGHRAGITIMPDPANFRRCWVHARDYGFVAANPFGRAAFRQGPPSKVIVGAGQQLRLRFGILLHAEREDHTLDLNDSYQDYLGQLGRIDNEHIEDVNIR